MDRKQLALLVNIPLGTLAGAAPLLAWGASEEWTKGGIRIGPTVEGLVILAALGGVGGVIAGTIAGIALGSGRRPLNWKSCLLCALCITALVGGNVSFFFQATLVLLGK